MVDESRLAPLCSRIQGELLRGSVVHKYEYRNGSRRAGFWFASWIDYSSGIGFITICVQRGYEEMK